MLAAKNDKSKHKHILMIIIPIILLISSHSFGQKLPKNPLPEGCSDSDLSMHSFHQLESDVQGYYDTKEESSAQCREFAAENHYKDYYVNYWECLCWGSNSHFYSYSNTCEEVWKCKGCYDPTRTGEAVGWKTIANQDCFCNDTDNDGKCDEDEACPNDPNKFDPGICGCGTPDIDTDEDGMLDCEDPCPHSPDPDCIDECPDDPNKELPGVCGCGVPDDDTDEDGVADCQDQCQGGDDYADQDGDGTPDACDECPNNPNPDCLIFDQGDDKEDCPSKHGNPIRIYNGNNIESATDLSFKSPFDGGLTFTRYYNSLSGTMGPDGFGWTHTYNILFYPEFKGDPDVIRIIDNTGRGIDFKWNGSVYEGQNRELSKIQPDGEGYVWNHTDDKRYVFGADGKLTSVVDKFGNRQVLTYSAENMLDTVTDEASGRSLVFYYDSNGRLDHIIGPVTDAVPDGIWISYGYDDNDNLTSAIHADGSGYVYVYNDPYDAHNMTAKKDALNHQISSWNYDASDRAYSCTNRDGKNVTIDYTFPEAIAVTDAYGVTRTYGVATIAGRKRVTTVEGTSGCASCGSDVVRYGYDSDRNLTEKEYRNGRIDKYLDYDANGHAQTVIKGFGSTEERTFSYRYHPTLDVLLSVTEPSVLGGGTKETIWDYDHDGNTIPNESPTTLYYRKIDRGFTLDETGAVVPYEYINTFDYNAKGQVLFVDGPLDGDQDKTLFGYDPDTGDLLSVTNPVTGATTYIPDDAGNTVSMTDINHVTATFTYDGMNRRLTSLRNGKTTASTYTLDGNLETVTDEEERTTVYTYDSTYGRLDTMTDMLGNYHKYGYDNLGHMTSDAVYDPDGAMKKLDRFNYKGPDYSGKLWKDINFNESYTEYGYGDSGNLVSVTSPDIKTVTYDYDSMNRRTSVTQPGNVVTVYDYDEHGNLAMVTDANNNATLYTCDDLGRVVEAVSPDTGLTRYSFTPLGKPASKTENNGRVTLYGYDAIGRPTTITREDAAENVILTYDQGPNGKGRLTGKTGQGYSYTFGYNADGRIETVTGTIGGHTFETVYTYDDSGILTGMTYPDGRTVTLGLDGNGRHVSASTAKAGVEKTLLENGVYKPFGPLAGFDLGNGIHESRVFDMDYNLFSISSGTVFDRTYGRDSSGKIRSITDNLDATRSQSFTYDDLDRLETATGIYGNLVYTYDNVGNRLTETEQNVLSTYTYLPETNIIESVTGESPSVFVHDENGGIVTRLNREQSGTPASTSGYLYNDDGQRIRKTTGAETRYYHYDLAGNLIAESDETGSLVTAYIYMDGLRIATVATDGTVCYYHNNHLATPEMMTDESGAIVWKADYKPFGEAIIDPASTVVNDFRFPGQYFDSETGLHYNWNRYYDPGTGRYLTPDPIGLRGGINLYGYVEGNPINGIDPWGLFFDGTTNQQEVAVAIEGTSVTVTIAEASGTSLLTVLGSAAVVVGVVLWPSEISPDEYDWSEVEPDDDCDNDCPPCSPYPEGTIGYKGPHSGHEHYPYGDPHMHLFRVNQNKTTCKCFWNQNNPDGESGSRPSPYWVNCNGGCPNLN